MAVDDSDGCGNAHILIHHGGFHSGNTGVAGQMPRDQRAGVVQHHAGGVEHSPDDGEGVFRRIEVFRELFASTVRILHLDIPPRVDVDLLNAVGVEVNLGTLGYLCELEEKDVFEAVDKLMKDDYMVEERMMLGGYGIKNGEILSADIALNDVVIHRTGALSVVNLIVYVNGEYLNTFRADGIIISTPTGSTGYNMSAGGPIVDPKAQMMLITPINDHNLSSKSIVISADEEVTVELGKRRSQKDEMVEVSFDGDSKVRLEVGDRFVVRRAEDTAKICKLSSESFLEILRRKMSAYT